MAKLHSEDKQFSSYIDLLPGAVREADNEKWQVFSLNLKNGSHSVRFGDVSSRFSDSPWTEAEMEELPSEVQTHFRAIVEFFDEEERQIHAKADLMMERSRKREELEKTEALEKQAHPTAVDGERIPLADGSFLERHPQDTGAKGYLVCRAPKDEVAQLVALLKRLAEHKSNSIRFETLEPTFELEITRQTGEADGEAGQVEDDGLRVQLFVDAGNVETEISRWDALGIRFFTNQTNLEQFIEALQKEFGC